jgi:hypothetical protein
VFSFCVGDVVLRKSQSFGGVGDVTSLEAHDLSSLFAPFSTSPGELCGAGIVFATGMPS